MDRNRSGGTINGVGQDLDVDVRLGADHRREIWGEMRTSAVPATVFAFLTDASQMMTWLAQSAKADARPGGIFRLADINGLWVEGTYVAAIPHQRVVFTWGGIEGLRPGQSTAEFALRADDNGTLLRLRHYGLPDPAVDVHRRGWKNSGLPKLKAVDQAEDANAGHKREPAAEAKVAAGERPQIDDRAGVGQAAGEPGDPSANLE